MQRVRDDVKSKITGDGSVTFFNSDFKEHYHSLEGAREEALAKYIVPSELERRLANAAVSVLDVCFGLGYNTLLAAEEAAKWRGSISVTALEIDKAVVGDASQSIDSKWQVILSELYKHSLYSSDYLNIEMIWGDARLSCSELIADHRQYDLIYHDPFSTQRNAQLWTVDFFKKLYLLLKTDGVVLTYSTALPVLVGFLEAGFFIGKSEQVGEQRIGTVAAKSENMIKYPYSDDEMLAITESAKSVPYRDLSQCGENNEILRERNEKVVIGRQNDYVTK